MFSDTEMLIFIVVVGIGTFLTRVIPFIFLPDSKATPEIVLYLGRVLPAACMGLLLIYCLKGVDLLSDSHGIPEFIGIACAILLHHWKGNALLSIFGSTVIYMILVQAVFV